MNFYEAFCVLCEEKKVKRSRALLDAGLSKGLLTKWANHPETVPNGETLSKLCNYFCVDPSFFLKNERSTVDDDSASKIFAYKVGLLTEDEKAQTLDYIEFLLQKRGR